jgi:putative membrane protein
MKHALTQFTEDPGSGQELEREFFSKIGTNSNVRVGTVSFRKKEPASTPERGRQPGNQKLKSLWVIPSIHPGPFGHLGGSNLPYKLYQSVKNLTSSLMVFHGPTTHDYNPVATSECRKISKAIKKLVNTTEYSDTSTSFLRKTLDSMDSTGSQNSNSKPNRSGLNLCGQRLGNGSVYVHTSSPESTDDIDYPVGEGVIQRAQHETNKRALFIDAHNCLEPGTGQVYFGSEKANNLMKLVSSVNQELQEQDGHKSILRCGCAENTQFKVSDGLGPLGIQVLVVKCESENEEGKTNAYVLMDGNNVVPGLREKILDSLVGIVDDGEVFTTDNHVVNATMGGYNPVGLKLEQSKIIGIVKKLVESAKDDCELCEVGVNSTIVKNIRILGQNTPLRLSATINSTISVMKSSLVACEGLAFMLCLFFVLIL